MSLSMTIKRLPFSEASSSAFYTSWSSVSNEAAMINYLHRETGIGPTGHDEYLKAYRFQLPHHSGGLAFIEQSEAMRMSLRDVCVKQIAEIGKKPALFQVVESEVRGYGRDCADVDDKLAKFFDGYKTEIEAAANTREYWADRKVIDGIVAALQRATFAGEFLPEYVPIPDGKGGKKLVQSPRANLMRRIAERVKPAVHLA